ncbi:MAG: cellulase family glycosylhydrolase [Capsulimonadaceae bacterium]|nr:cellulase family glycosylhydrolase [Capsulimonadaceae bacterium]
MTLRMLRSGSANTILSLSLLALLASPLLAAPLQPPAKDGLFSFDIQTGDSSRGTATDMSFLNSSSAGAHGRIVAKSGAFVETQTKNRVRLLGVSIVGSSLFPSHAIADRTAAHLAKMGINLVRCHLQDLNDSPLWDKSTGAHLKMDSSALDRLDYFIYQLKEHGIYVDLNLHSGRRFTPADGFPKSVDELPGRFGQPVDIFDARMIELQRLFAHDYLTHVNPYTRMSYVQDPCVAMVEINNENSLLTWHQDRGWLNLPEPFSGELAGKWNEWLKHKYGTDDALRTAWLPHFPTLPKTFQLTMPWSLEDHTTMATLTATAPASSDAPSPVRIDTPVVPDAAWKVQAKLGDLDLTEGESYILSFRAKADRAERPLGVFVTIDQPDWHGAGLDRHLLLNGEWQSFRLVFAASHVVPKRERILFTTGSAAGPVWVSDVKLASAVIDDVMPGEQSLKTQTIRLPDGALQTAMVDWRQFQIDTDKAYADSMRAYLVNDLGVHSCIIDTQVEYGGLAGLRRESASDYVDHHSYINHPAKAEDPVNWSIINEPLVNAIEGGTFRNARELACSRLDGKPYAVSEFNHPAPSDYQSDTIPFLATFAAAQDWDSITWFAYDLGRNTMQGWFDMRGNPAKEAFFPAAAAIFRMGEMQPFQRTALLTIAASDLLSSNRPADLWTDLGDKANPDVFSTRYAVKIDARTKASGVNVTDAAGPGHPTIQLERTASGPIYVASGKGALAATGFVGGQSINREGISLTFPAFGNNFASFTVTSVDGKPLDTSKRLLLTIVGHAEKQGMGWNPDRSSIGNKWGQGPALAEGIPATVTLSNASVMHVWALDPDGARTKEVPATIAGGKVAFTISPDYKTVWYEIAAK